MNDRKSDRPLHDRDLRRLAIDLISEQSTLTFATAQKDVAWAAPVYYVNRDFHFYFFSGPDSRHVLEALANGQASAAIFAPASTWKEIRGVQMSGAVHTVSPGLESIQILRIYLKKYPFTSEFLEPDKKFDLDALLKKFRVRLYRFKPDLLYYLDNSIRFSFRQEINLHPN